MTRMLSLRPLNPDNLNEVTQLVNLFRQIDDYPIKNVYQPQFWTKHAGSRFISIQIFDDKDLIGHFALSYEKTKRSVVQLGLIAILGNSKSFQAKVISEIKTLLQQVSDRQKFEIIYSFVFEQNSLAQRLATELGLITSAICPSYVIASDAERLSISICQKVINPPEKLKVFTPNAHHEIIKKIYNTIKIDREISSTATISKKLKSDQHAAIQSRYFQANLVEHIFVRPSLLNKKFDISQPADQQKQALSRYIFVNAHDPEAINFCEMIEKQNYIFCGVTPQIEGCDSLLFWKGPQNTQINSYIDCSTEKDLSKYISKMINTNQKGAQKIKRKR